MLSKIHSYFEWIFCYFLYNQSILIFLLCLSSHLKSDKSISIFSKVKIMPSSHLLHLYQKMIHQSSLIPLVCNLLFHTFSVSHTLSGVDSQMYRSVSVLEISRMSVTIHIWHFLRCLETGLLVTILKKNPSRWVGNF